MGRPASKFAKSLSQADRQFLLRVWREHKTYTVRCRAHAILLSSQGYTVSQLQDIFHISKPTALAWVDRWEEDGQDGLEDAPRPGGPPILVGEEEELLKKLFKRFPHQPNKVLQALREKTGKVISRRTLRRLARKLRLRWKRLRRTNKKPPDHNRKFRIAQEEIDELRSIPNLTVAYLDEAGFSLQGVVPYGWQPIGERSDVWLGTERGSVQVLGIEEEDGATYGYLHKGPVYGKTVAEVLEDYSQRISGPTVIVLDNASVHTCGLVQEQMERWNERGLFFYFLPPQSPELNDIERLWKRLKYQDLPLDAWESLKSLVSRLKDTFRGIGDAILLPSLQN